MDAWCVYSARIVQRVDCGSNILAVADQFLLLLLCVCKYVEIPNNRIRFKRKKKKNVVFDASRQHLCDWQSYVAYAIVTTETPVNRHRSDILYDTRYKSQSFNMSR